MVDYNDKNYDYVSYWANRSYEHDAEVFALKKLFPKSGDTIVDIGGGFGRLLPVYEYRFKQCVIFEPSEKLLEQAKINAKKLNVSNFQTVCGDVYEFSVGNKNLCSLREGLSYILMVRVSHHLDNLEKAISQISKSLKPGDIFILEIANKNHFKNVLKNLLKGNFKFSSSPNYKMGSFTLWNPKYAEETLVKSGFKIEDKLSVSNFRSTALKNMFGEKALLFLENLAQKPLAFINFGPSIFYKAVRA